MCAPSRGGRPYLVRRGQRPLGPGPQVQASDAEAAENRALILRPYVPARPARPSTDLLSARSVPLAAKAATKLIVVLEVRIEVSSAEAVAATFRDPREAHPRSPERIAAHEAAASQSPLRW